MTRDRDDGSGLSPELSPEDRRWVEALAAELRPEPMDAVRRAAFHRRLEARLARPRPARLRLAALAAGAAALAALWIAAPRTPEPAADPAALLAFVDPDAFGADRAESRAYLPDDYRAIASLLELEAEEP